MVPGSDLYFLFNSKKHETLKQPIMKTCIQEINQKPTLHIDHILVPQVDLFGSILCTELPFHLQGVRKPSGHAQANSSGIQLRL